MIYSPKGLCLCWDYHKITRSRKKGEILDLAFLEEQIPDIRMYRIECHPEKIAEEDFPEYRRLCALFEQVTERFIRNEGMFFLEATGVILQAFAILLQSFSEKIPLEPTGRDALTRERIRKVIAFVEEHYMEQVSLDDMAGLLGFGKEYFCRFFKKNMGMPFGRYLAGRLMSEKGRNPNSSAVYTFDLGGCCRRGSAFSE